MSTMRVYEYSKLSGIPTKKLLDALAKGGFAVASHMSVLTAKELTFLNELFKQSKGPSVLPNTPVDVQAEKITTPVTPSSTKKAQMPQAAPEIPFVVRSLVLSDAAEQLKQPVAMLIITLLRWGIVATKNQLLDEAVVARLAENFGVQTVKHAGKEHAVTKGIVVENGTYQERLPVVVVVGHVDHGKTTLLDYIRKTRVASREKGGITQHLGAYEATTPHGSLVFIDTPGHEAFARMRARGIGLADVAVLVVAGDDGVMPQTIEAIKHIKLMNLPVVVAINKIDKAEKTRLEAIKRDLSQHGLVPEEWAGDTVIVPISAKMGTGIDQLLEMIILQAQLLELKADTAGRAKGYILESSLEKGRGPVATVLAQHGTISVGDFFVCGDSTGRVSSLIDSHGARVTSIGASHPVRVAGFSELAQAGDYFEVVDKDSYLKSRAAGVSRESVPAASLVKENAINLVVKADNHSSREALVEAIAKLSKKYDKPFAVISATIGDVNESDINLAQASGSRIVCLHCKISPFVVQAARQHHVTIESFDIIYKLLERLEEIADSYKVKQVIRTKTGEAEVRKVFDIKGQGIIAGCYVKDGRFVKDGIIIAWRGKVKLGEGKIKSLQRDRKIVKEVTAGYECAFLVEGIDQWAEGDRAECYIQQ